MKAAAIDIGTNSIHMVVVRIEETPSFQVVDREKDMVHLGEGGLAEGLLTAAAMERGLAALARMKQLSLAHGCELLVATATSAVREAENREEFLTRCEQEIGIKVRVLSGEEEAELIFRAVRDGTDLSEHKALVFDLGGGSTEVVVGNNFGIHLCESLALGVVRGTDEFAQNPAVTSPKRYKALAKRVRQLAGPAMEHARAVGFDQLLASSGTAKQLAELLTSPRHPGVGDSPHLPAIRTEDLHELTSSLQRLDQKGRAAVSGMNPRRAGNIAVGATIVNELVKLAGVSQVQISNRALRDGLILEVVRTVPELERAFREGPDLRERSIRVLAQVHPDSVEHGLHVAGLAEQIYDQTGGLHQLGTKERQMLGFAARLHDVGRVIGYSRHHRHSQYVVSNAELAGFAPREVSELALITRYHRKTLPRSSHAEYHELPKDRRRVVSTLAAILRVADGLDRSHQMVVKQVRVLHAPDQLRFELATRGDCQLEMAAAARKGDLMEHVWGRSLAFESGAAGELVQPTIEVTPLV